MNDSPHVLLLGDCVAADQHAMSVVDFVEEQLVSRGATVSLLLPDRRPHTSSQTCHDGVIVVSRERNRSYSGQIKMMIDAMDPRGLEGRPFGLLSYSATSPLPTAIDHLRVIVGALRGVAIPSEVCMSVTELQSTPERAQRLQPTEETGASITALVTELLHYSQRMRTRRPDPPRPAPHASGVDVARPVQGSICAEIAAAVSFIKANFADQSLSLDMVASAVFMSRYHFSRKFREQTGRRFIDYVIMLRMTEARRLLLQTNLTVTSIAANVGYRDLSNFERSFKKFFNIQPTQYRLRHSSQTGAAPDRRALRVAPHTSTEQVSA